MTDLNIPAIIESCDRVGRIAITIGDKRHGSAWLFDNIMRAFTNKNLPAQAVTYSVFLNAPVMKPGTVTIDRDGWLTVRAID